MLRLYVTDVPHTMSLIFMIFLGFSNLQNYSSDFYVLHLPYIYLVSDESLICFLATFLLKASVYISISK